MMAQYRRIKGELPRDALLLFRLGDFYEMFFEDAQIGAQLMNLALTQRQSVPMCGLPYHAAAGYIGRLLKAGRKVAICDQMEEPRPGQLVKREVTQILSPGTHFDERMLQAERNNYLAAVCRLGGACGLAVVDLTTGSFRTTEVEGDPALLTELERLRPAEIIFPAEDARLGQLLRTGRSEEKEPARPLTHPAGHFSKNLGSSNGPLAPSLSPSEGKWGPEGRGRGMPGAFLSAASALGWILNRYEDWVFAPETAQFTVREHFKVASLDGFGLKNRVAAMGAAGAVLHYLTQHLRRDVAHLTSLSFYQPADFLVLDATTLRHLEILEPLHRDAPRTACLYGILNRTVTPMGARRLRDWLSQPLADAVAIRRRQDVVQIFSEQPEALEGFRVQLREVRDLERTMGRLSVGTGNARDLVALRSGLEQVPALKRLLGPLGGTSSTSSPTSLSEAHLLTPAFSSDDEARAERDCARESAAEITAPAAASGETRSLPRSDERSHGNRTEGKEGARSAGEGEHGARLAQSESASLPGLPLPTPPQALRDQAASVPCLLADLEAQLTDLPALVELIARAIVDEPPLALKEGGLIRDGFDAALDELRAATRGGKDWIARLQQQEIERTGIASLKVRFNSVFGYFLEVTKANLDKVPPHYVRKQTIANGERFFTPELKEMESKILGAQERSVKLEYDLFLKVREEALAWLKPIQQTADALAQLDVLASFAETARLHNYCRPRVGAEGVLCIRDGRHPVLEQHLTEERFVPNDVALAGSLRPDPGELTSPSPHAERGAGEARGPKPEGGGAVAPSALPQIALITGPNMAGKSTFIRQVALLALLAHTGSFLPAREARVDLLDRIFTRIGASDDLARGQSTFMVEMSETANILNNASPRSLVILDEIGRGTSTFDGLSLAWAIVEHLHHQVGAKTLFATHYHELTELAARLPRLRNFNVAVREWSDQIVFLRKIVVGGTDKSYGIHVARLAGVPRAVVDRAKVILGNLEESELTPEGTVRHPVRHKAERDKLQQLTPPPQLDLFG
jgi:DNA mismatch repair protein MutS